MTITMFVLLATICCAVSALLTQGIKIWMQNAGKKYSANLIALIDALVVGCGGTAIAYILLAIPFTPVGVVYIILMGGVVWLGSMVGYDKVMQLIAQIIGGGSGTLK